MPTRTMLQAVLVVVLCGITLGASPAEAVFDAFLNIPGLQGESTDDRHPNEITLVSYTQTVGTNACFRGIAIKNLDRASPGLALLAVTNQVVPSMTVTLTRAGDPPFDAFIALLENVTVGNVELVEVEGAPLPTERVTLRPRRATLTYRLQSTSGGPATPFTTIINCP